MLELFYDATPNAWKITIMLQECALAYRARRIDLQAGEQFTPDFLSINPNGKIPVLVDHLSASDAPLTISESGAILLYLADATGRFLPRERMERHAVIQWLMWQMSALGPIAGQNGHFLLYAPERIPYAIDRFGGETARLYGVLDAQLGRTGRYIAGDYSIADIACFPWIMTHKRQGLSLDDYPDLRRWFTDVRARPGVQAGLADGGGPGGIGGGA